MMLYPQTNKCRQVTDLSGFWDLKPDPKDTGETHLWFKGFDSELVAGVPGSWNEQLAEAGLMNYVGKVWYQKRFNAPPETGGRRSFIRFGAADFNARVWLNGNYLGGHKGGFLPFEFEVTGILSRNRRNVLVVCNDNRLDHDSIPQGLSEADYIKFGRERDLTFPPTVFDFFAYGGLSRGVYLYSRPECAFEMIDIRTHIKDVAGRVTLKLHCSEKLPAGRIRVTIDGDEETGTTSTAVSGSRSVKLSMDIPNCIFWEPDNPHLYRLRIALYQGEDLIDEYFQEAGVREVRIEGDNLLLNGKPLYLKGFGKHEDFAVLGHGVSHPLIVKDFQMMRWIGANSFRTSHYPYAEEVMQLADRLGFLVIDEVPAVSLNFKYVTNETLNRHKHMLTELIQRDRNHPCVIAWSIANEPGIWGEEEAVGEKALRYWREISIHTRKLDDSRPVTLPACAKWGTEDPAFEFSDFISLNRYWGWYEIPGETEKAGACLRAELEDLYKKYKKPVMLTEFGADTMEGFHATYVQMFSEEYQTALLSSYFETLAELPFVIGEHIWNFADFRTAQNHRRVVLNKKGLFTRQREPKSAAFMVRRHWNSS